MDEMTLEELSATSSNPVPNDMDKTSFEEKCNNFLDKWKRGTTDIIELESLLTASTLSRCLNHELVLRFLDKLPEVCIWASKTKNTFFEVLKTIFLASEGYNDILSKYFKRYMENFDRVPNWKPSYELYDSEMTGLLNRLGSHTQFQGNEVAMTDLCYNFAWLFLLAPKPSIWSFLNHCLDSKQVVPSAMRILRQLTGVLRLKLNIEGLDVVDNRKPLVSMILCALRRMLVGRKFNFSRESMPDGATNDNDWDRYVYLVASFTREKHNVLKEKGTDEDGAVKTREVIGEEILEEALLSGTEVLKGIVLPELFARRSVVPMLEIMLKIISYFQGPRISAFCWVANFNEDPFVYEKISAPFLLRLLVDMYNENLKGDEQVRNLCLKALAALGQRLNDDKIAFDLKSTHEILKYLNRYDWSFKYSIVTWFSTSLGSPKRQIPTGLYKALSEKQRQNYEQILVDFDYVLSDCFFRSIYELIRVAPQLAIELIKKGFEVKPSGDDLFVKIAFEFMVSASHESYESFDRFSTLFDALKCLLKNLDYSVRPFMPLPITESAVYGLRLIEPVVILGNVVVIAVNLSRDDYKLNSPRKQLMRASRKTAEKLLEHYCRLTKDHLERELQDLRRSRLKYVPAIKDPLNIFSDVRIDRAKRVFTQVAELFFLSSMIAGQYAAELPSCLKILLLKLSQYQKEVIGYLNVPSLDDLSNDAMKNTTYYAYAKNSPDADSLSIDSTKLEEEKHRESPCKMTNSEKRRQALLKMNPSTFQVVYSESYGRDSKSTDYFTKLARQVPDSAIKQAMLKNISTSKAAEAIFEQAMSDIKKQSGLE